MAVEPKSTNKNNNKEPLSMPKSWGYVEQAPLIERVIADTAGYLNPAGLIFYATGVNPEQYIRPYNWKHYSKITPIEITDTSTDAKAKLYKKIVEDLKKTSDGQLDDLAVRIGGTNFFSDAARTLLNRRTSLLGKAVGTLGNAVNNISANLSRSDHYNPFAHSVTIYSDNPAILTHELGHAINLNSGKRPVYKGVKDRILTDLKNIPMDVYRANQIIPRLALHGTLAERVITPAITLGVESAANVRSSQAVKKLKDNTVKKILLEERQRTLPGALASYGVPFVTPLVGAGAELPTLIGSLLAGRAYGHIRSRDPRSMRELNRELRKAYGIAEQSDTESVTNSDQYRQDAEYLGTAINGQNDAMPQSMLKFSDYNAIATTAKPYWDSPGRGWDHGQAVLRDAQRLVGRPLTDQETATVLFHDTGIRDFGRKDHGITSAGIFREHAKSLGFSPKDSRQIAAAISRHMSESRSKNNFRNPLLKLLVEADQGVPVSGDLRLKKPIDYWANGRGLPLSSPTEKLVKHIRGVLDKERYKQRIGFGPFTDRYKTVFSKELEDQNNWYNTLSDEHIAELIERRRKQL